MTQQLTLKYGITDPEIAEGAIAMYGVRAIHVYPRGYGAADYATFDVPPTCVDFVSIDQETKDRFVKMLNGEDCNGLIAQTQILYGNDEEWIKAVYAEREIMTKPYLLLDLGYVKAYARRATGYCYITWALYDEPINFDGAYNLAMMTFADSKVGKGWIEGRGCPK